MRRRRPVVADLLRASAATGRAASRAAAGPGWALVAPVRPGSHRARPQDAGASAWTRRTASARDAPDVQPGSARRGAARGTRRPVTPKMSGASLGIANWCSEWKSRCWERWPWVIVRSARERRPRASRARDVGRAAARPARRQLRRVGPAVLRGQLGDRVVVVAELAPDVTARSTPSEAVQAPLVVGQPVVVDPVLGRQPVRRRGRRGQRVERGLRDLDDLGRGIGLRPSWKLFTCRSRLDNFSANRDVG